MKTLTIKSSAALLSLALFVSLVAAQSDVQYRELPNFRKVNANLYRGGQPDSTGIKRLAELGIKTVVNLRGEDDRTREEEAAVTSLGLRYVGIPMAGLSRPSDEQVSRVLAIIDDPQNWPVFIHCKRGADRTGTVIACYRIGRENWNHSQAISEARRCGMSWIEFGMRDYIEDFHRRHITDRKEAVTAAKR